MKLIIALVLLSSANVRAGRPPWGTSPNVLEKKGMIIIRRDYVAQPMTRWTKITREPMKCGWHDRTIEVSCSFGHEPVNGRRLIRTGRGFLVEKTIGSVIQLRGGLSIHCSGYDPNGVHVDDNGDVFPGAQVELGLEEIVCGLKGAALIRKAPPEPPRDF